MKIAVDSNRARVLLQCRAGQGHVAEPIVNQVGGAYGFNLGDLRGRDRHARITWARHVCMWVLRRMGMTTHQVGAVLLRNHSAVSYGTQRVAAYREVYPELLQETEQIFNTVTGVETPELSRT